MNHLPTPILTASNAVPASLSTPLSTPFQRLPTGCVFQPPIPPVVGREGQRPSEADLPSFDGPRAELN